MFKNYLRVALRNLLRNKAFSAINIFGLSIGISSALVVFLIVHYDYSFDRFEPGADRIFRVVTDFSYQGNIGHSRGVPAPLGEVIGKELTGIEEISAFRYYNVQKTGVPAMGKKQPGNFKVQSDVIFADAHYFKLLPYLWKAGSASSALSATDRVVLGEARAKLYFPGMAYKDMIGQKIIYDDTIRTTVSGIVADLDTLGQTDFAFKEFISLATIKDNKWMRDKLYWDQWGSITSDHQVYVRLAKGVKPSTVDAGLKKLFDKYFGADAKKSGFKQTYTLQPLNDIHFNSNYGTWTQIASMDVLDGLMLVAVFLLLLGCINFVNLTTAQASQRAKEIGIRKTMGSSKGQLMVQFLCETFVITLLATGLSVAITPLLLKAFADFVPEGLHFSQSEPYLLGFVLLLVIVISLVAGFYPAMVLSSWKPIKVLKSQQYADAGGSSKTRVRQSLTVLQFVVAQAFVMATLLVGKQIGFMLNKDLGFRKEAILSFSTPHYTDTSLQGRIYLVHELEQIPGVLRVSLGNDVPSSGSTWSNFIKYNDGKKQLETDVQIKFGDTGYLSIFHIPLLAGRGVVSCDTTKEAIINETYMQVLGFQKPQDALGKTLQWNDRSIPIVGVMKNFYAHPLDWGEIKAAPMVFTEANKDCHQVIVALQPGAEAKTTWPHAIKQVEDRYKRTYPGEEFQYDFFDARIASAYQGEQRIAQLLKWATGITVFISCLGLLGLVIFTIRVRVKEIGVRKVLGASVTDIVSILSKEFVKLVLIAFLLATPIAWYVLHRWLNNFGVRTEVSWWIFAISGFGMIGIAFITLSVQTIRAARANPVHSLRTE